jgi:hypothetical protein
MTLDETLSLRHDRTRRLVFWAGAGISIPSHMPGGVELTTRWLQHLLPEGELHSLLELFARMEPTLGRRVPRLEQVIDDAITVFGPACLATLDFFHDCPPNGLHRALARSTFENNSLVFTTNFDSALECAGWPLETVTPSNGRLCERCVVKVHGSIDEPLEALGHSIRNLQAGLEGHVREMLESTLQRDDTVVVFVGYSGSDFLDVVPVFMDRRAARVRASALWIAYSPEPLSELAYDDWQDTLGDGAFRMLGAFDDDRRHVLKGQPTEVLRRLGVAVDAVPVVKRAAWDDTWERRFRPAEPLRRLYAARLYASIGHSSRCLEQLAAAAPAIRTGPQAAVILEAALDAAGCVEAAADVRRSAGLAEIDGAGPALSMRRHLASAVRTGHPWRGLWGYRLAMRKRHGGVDAAAAAVLAIEAALSGIQCGRTLEARLRRWGLGGVVRLFTRLWAGRCLERQHRIRLSNPAACSHPHIIAARHRVADYLANFPGKTIAWMEDKVLFRRDGLPIHDIVDDTGFNFLESDNLLGFAESERDCAERLLEAVRYDPERDDETRQGVREEARARLAVALAIARLLGNLDLQCAALRTRQRNPEIRGGTASALRRRRVIASLEARLASLDRSARHGLGALIGVAPTGLRSHH